MEHESTDLLREEDLSSAQESVSNAAEQLFREFYEQEVPTESSSEVVASPAESLFGAEVQLPYSHREHSPENPYGKPSVDRSTGRENPHNGALNNHTESRYGLNRASAAPEDRTQRSPYGVGYYHRTGYGTPYVSQQPPYYGGIGVPMYQEAAPAPPMPIVKERKETVFSLILGIVAMGLVNFIPFIPLVLGIIATCTGYIGLRQGELTKGKRICGCLGLALGIISLILSAMLLTMLLCAMF